MTTHVWDIAADYKFADYKENTFVNTPFLTLCGTYVRPSGKRTTDVNVVEKGDVVGCKVGGEKYKTLITPDGRSQVTCDYCILLLLEVETEENGDFVLQ